jgi:deazaflavin-dependent oxidoreductase (nitroreductase family)
MTVESPSDRGAELAPVAPAAIVRMLVRPLTKMLNPVMVRLAGRRFFPMAQIHHLGRRSGRAYVTPTSAHLRGDVLLIGLTFGNQSDWSRNVRAAGGGTVRLGGHTYRATSPELITGQITGHSSRPRSTQYYGPHSAFSAYSSSCACTWCSPQPDQPPTN